MTAIEQSKPQHPQRPWWHQSWQTWVIIAGFALLAFTYFCPAVLEGRDLFQNDVAGASGTAQDVRDYSEKTGEVSYWTNSLFSGMPMYQIAPSYPSLELLKHVQDFLTLQWPLNLLPSYSWLLFAMMWGFYLFMRSLKVARLYALLGAIMWTFSSYFVILIEAGHIWKLMVLSFVPPTIAGIIWSYEGKYLKGGVLTAFFASLQLMSNHIQMSYYFAFVIGFLILSYLYRAIRQKQYKPFLMATGVTLLAALVSIGVNLSNIYHTYQYTQETMRGGSALSDGAQAGSGSQSGGLDKEYITAWSYGKAETLTFLIPNLYGGATGRLGDNASALEQISDASVRDAVAGMNHYWGDQPFTSGPVYVGAFVLFLAILGCFVVRTPLKWALLAATLLSLLLGWGHNLMWVSDLFIDYFPLYNKFRTVSSILVIAEFTIPTLAVLALLSFVRDPKAVLAERIPLYVSLALTLGVALVLALAPGLFFSFMSYEETEMFRPYLGDPRALEILSALKHVRAGIVTADAWRSVGILVVCLGLAYSYAQGLIKSRVLLVLLTAVTLLDLWTVDKRYLNDEKFIAKSLIEAQATPITEADEVIRADRDPHYRVLNLTVSTFSDATTSYAHRSIGGYHAAKLSRYQDLIEHQISKGNQQVLNMLDMRYVITRDSLGNLVVERNDGAQGPAWFVSLDQVQTAETPQEEMEALTTLNLSRQAVIPRDEQSEVSEKAGPHYRDSITVPRGSVELIEYTPNRAKYRVRTEQEQLLVFSEIYYPHGWQLALDGKPHELLRANYLLRATLVPPGVHELEMRFDPQSVHLTEAVSYAAQLLLVLGLLGLGLQAYRKNRKR